MTWTIQVCALQTKNNFNIKNTIYTLLLLNLKTQKTQMIETAANYNQLQKSKDFEFSLKQ